MRTILFFFLTPFIVAVVLNAQERDDFSLERFNLYFENDIFDQTDRDYTNGVKFSAIYRVNTEVYAWLRPPLVNDASKNHFVTLSLGQEIYTPDDTSLEIPDPNDRPYAGWLYFGFALHQADAYQADSLELQLGVVGPAALGEEIQNGIHKLTGSHIAQGWDYQLHNELGVVLAYKHRWRYVSDTLFWGINADAVPFVGGALGNVHTYANGGATMRIGWNIPEDFGKLVTHAGLEAGLPAFDKGTTTKQSTFSFYFLSAFDGYLVARNIFLDGNTFKESASVPERDYAMAEFTAGFGVDYSHYHLAFFNTHQTQNFPGDVNGFSFGTIMFSYVY